VTNFGAMFMWNQGANPNVHSWNTGKATSMIMMFLAASNAVLDRTSGTQSGTENWDVSNVKSFREMFQSATKANPDVSKWVTSSASDLAIIENVGMGNTLNGLTNDVAYRGMFQDAVSATAQTSGTNWCTVNVKSLESMFQNANVANPNVASFNTYQVTSVAYMFQNAREFVAEGGDNQMMRNWNLAALHSGMMSNAMQSMFDGAEKANPNLENWFATTTPDANVLPVKT
jgi:hypothetical protein